MSLITKHFLIFLAMLQFACSGTSRRKKDDSTGGPERRGTSVEIVELKYYDGLPSVSADGKKVAFISGRNDIRQAFWRNLDNDDEAVRVLQSSNDEMEELEAVMSPDGNFVLVLTYDNAEFALYMQSLNADTEPVEVHRGRGRKSLVGISPDSTHLVYQLRNNETKKDEIWIGAIAGDLASVSLQQLGNESEYRQPKFSSSTAGQHTLLIMQNAETIGETSLSKVTFNSGQNLGGVTPTEFYSNVLASDYVLATGTLNAFVLRDMYSQVDIQTRSSSGNVDEPSNVNVITEIDQVKIADGANQTLASAGFRVRDVSANSAGDLVSSVVNERVECKAIEGEGVQTRFTASLYLYNANDGSKRLLLPVSDENLSAWELAEPNLCLNYTGEGESKKLDDRVSRSVINADADANSFTVVYETQFSKNNGEYSDREIRALVVNGSDITFKEISANPKPLE